MAAGACSDQDDEAASPLLAAPPETDVPYGTSAGCPGSDEDCGGSQQVDIYRSDRPGPNPVVVYFHGGGFVGGDKQDSISEYLDVLRDDGWDILSANYRLTTTDGANRFPAALQDAKRVVRWVKANAEAQDWDPANVAAMGHSAGGNLASLLAVTADQPEFEPSDLPGPLAAVDSSVIAAVGLNPVMDLSLFAEQARAAQELQLYTGCEQNCANAFAKGSVQPHVDPEAAPMLALHGDQDILAAPIQGERVRDSYTRNGIGERFELVRVDDGPERFRRHEVDYERFADQFAEFLDQQRR